MILLLSLLLIVFIHFKYRPYIDVTREQDVLLWYTKNGKREFKHLFKLP
jgi:hypothetical protein